MLPTGLSSQLGAKKKYVFSRESSKIELITRIATYLKAGAVTAARAAVMGLTTADIVSVTHEMKAKLRLDEMALMSPSHQKV